MFYSHYDMTCNSYKEDWYDMSYDNNKEDWDDKKENKETWLTVTKKDQDE